MRDNRPGTRQGMQGGRVPVRCVYARIPEQDHVVDARQWEQGGWAFSSHRCHVGLLLIGETRQ